MSPRMSSTTRSKQIMSLRLVVADGTVVGQLQAMIHRHPDTAPELYIDNLGVTPAFQRRGVATRLFEDVIAHGRKRGCDRYWVGTESDNEPAKQLYSSLSLKSQASVFYEGRIEPEGASTTVPTDG